ncbi:gem-associated protein 2-like protein [Dinothrombium tinctorium]|uniref:Gem-associated protein 2 n=1 Tax=Dinothrombium tinctorium TaxID=1965070 RepID=A0A3S3P608_9ACAR|nr:gem-associated protein 2-like protein [Dinothrombium tinctorium]
MFSDDECDEDVEYGMCRVLPVSSFTQYDPSKPPTTGADYLRRVQLEAMKCPDIVVADLNVEEYNNKRTLVLTESNGFIKASKDICPSLEWQRQQVADFNQLRLKIADIKLKLAKSQRDARYAKLVKSKRFLENYKSCKNNEQQFAFFEYERPLLKSLLQLSQNDIHNILVDHIRWIKQAGYSYFRGLWIYSLLAFLEKPLQSEVYSTLRDLSRLCSVERSSATFSSDSEEMTSLNLIICLIGRYFNQLDMVDNSE